MQTYWIEEIDVRVNQDRLVIKGSQADKDLQGFKDEKRYVVCGSLGISSVTALVRCLVQDFPRLANETIDYARRYVNDRDNTYFKFLDDAEWACNNINACVEWLNKNNIKFNAKQKRLFEKYRYVTTHKISCSLSEEKMKALSLTLRGKRRADLTESQRDLLEARDIVSRELR
jgi:hypothetical protein